jgi:hypothetical protein
MGNTYLEPKTKANLLEYMDKNDHRTVSRGIDTLLAEHDLLLVTQRECDLLRERDRWMIDGEP